MSDFSFRTNLPPHSTTLRISYQSPLLFMGSCFAEHIAQRMTDSKFDLQLNPFGILYNPISIAKSLQRLLSYEDYSIADLVIHQGVYHSFDHHSRFSGTEPEQAVQKINEALRSGREQLSRSHFLVLTLGTAFIYQHLDNQQAVANCHKFPASAFRQIRLRPETIVQHLAKAIEQLLQAHPAINILFTVSPVRHIKEGLINNQRSKAALLLAIEELEQQFAQVHYFPAYELLMDDLRDYRFYADDLIHPSSLAVEYIWQYFQQTYWEETTRQIYRKVQKVRQASAHKAFFPESEVHQQFLRKQLENVNSLEKEYPFLDLRKEKNIFSDQLLNS